MVKKTGLGKGLEALFNENQLTKEEEMKLENGEEIVQNLKLIDIEPNRDQPRRTFNSESLEELATSIKRYGVIQPIIVTKMDNYYQIVAGERRWRAAKLAGLKKVPVIIKEFSEQEAVEISLIENIQRENLNPIEEAIAYKRLIEEFSLKQDEVAERVSKSRTAVTNSMRLLKLDERVRQMVIDEMLSTGHARTLLAIEDAELQYSVAMRIFDGHARAILAITDKDKQASVAMKIFDEKLSVRETEKLVKDIMNPKKRVEKVQDSATEAIYRGLEERIKGILGTKVSIHRSGKQKGKIEIEYYSQDELERIMDLFESIG